MLIDITLNITPKMAGAASENTAKSLVGHMGTHFDVMDKEFPLEYTQRQAVVFDVSHIRGRDIEASDVDLARVEKDMFVAFYTGFLKDVEYGTKEYFGTHPQLSFALVEALLDRGISIIGVDCVGLRRHEEHTPTDQLCADKGAFVVENLVNLGALVGRKFTACTYPMHYVGLSGVPCRVIAETE